jgi:hypothetical protein
MTGAITRRVASSGVFATHTSQPRPVPDHLLGLADALSSRNALFAACTSLATPSMRPATATKRATCGIMPVIKDQITALRRHNA